MTRRYLRPDADPRPCSRCRLILPLAAFHVYIRGGRRLPRSWCRTCSAEVTQEWRGRHHDELLIRRRAARRTAPIVDLAADDVPGVDSPPTGRV